jgi:hypothetical protein
MRVERHTEFEVRVAKKPSRFERKLAVRDGMGGRARVTHMEVIEETENVVV